MLLAVGGCVDPKDRRPGMKLAGEPTAYPADWTFTDDYKEIAVEVSTPYLLPHSVTIWCATAAGQLYVGASAPETKNWPGWVDDNPDVTLKIGNEVYEVSLAPMDNPSEIAVLRAAYAEKYQLSADGAADRPAARYWAVIPRA